MLGFCQATRYRLPPTPFSEHNMTDQCQKTTNEDNKVKKNNLMSIIESLHSTTHEDPAQSELHIPSSSDASNMNPTQIMETNFPLKIEPDLDIGIPPESFRPLSPELNQERDVLGNVLKLLTQANNLGNIADSSQTSNAEDETILEMQQSSNSGVQQLLSSVANGTNQVKSILKNDVNIIYECKRCRGMFRALSNLIRHKKEYCKNIGVLSSFMNRETNSTAEEDAGFQMVLNTLHPPDPLSQNPQIFSNAYSQQYHTPNPAVYGTTANSTFTGSFPAPKIGPTTANHYIISNDGSSLPMTYRKPVGSNNNPTFSTASSVPKKGHPCPVCKRELSDRKSVRRHLIHIHGMNVMEAVKVTHSAPPRSNVNNATTASCPQPLVNKPKKRVYEHSGNLQELSIETIDVGNERKILVLPEDFAISSSKCPVCARTLCRRTNVRRHLLEAHQFIIKGERKYHQLKDIVGNKLPGSPSLRNLRNVGMISESLNSLKNSEKEKKSDAISGRNDNSGIAIESETTADKVTGNKVDLGNSKPGPVVNTTTVDKKSENDPSLKAVVVVSKVSNANSNSAQNIKLESTKEESMSSDAVSVAVDAVLDLSPYKCPECTKTFTRRQTFKNHMFSFHQCSEKKFEGMFTDTDSQVTDKESSKGSQKCSMKKERRASNDEEPPKKIRKSELKQLFTKLPSIPNDGSVIQGSVGNATTSKCFTLIPVNTNDNVLKNSNTIIVGNGTNLFQNGTAGKTKPIYLKPLSTSSSPIAPTTIRPFIQVKLNRSIVATKAMNTISTVSSKQVSILNSKTSIVSVPRTKTKQMYDIEKKICYECDKVFESSQEVKAHLLQRHSLSHEDALTYSTESSNVSPEDQEAGIENGFDILSAKCLICNRLYFSRINLTKHMLKFHHVMPDKLKGLAVPEEVLSKSHSNQSAVQSTTTLTNVDEKPPPRPQHKLRNARKSVTEKTSKNSRFNPTGTPPKITVNGNCFAVSEESILCALEKFPKELINPQKLRCLRCKHKYKKMWDLKIHLLRHVGLGLFACKHCPKPTIHMSAVRSIDVLKHLQISHDITITNKNRSLLIGECRIDNGALWDAYDIPLRKR